ncbi:radical SAM protein [Candidatus Woesearchaeota archaeon]|jgi:MoaA/NifB/PqqE/SkfB family radical SAM enzyme|nr:radical SAM protein [Candidatus Woesearchaeota archaeon]MBT5397206.1 radical SAM protein [Candidatus Woesearchaeota archaeon]MBT6367248.1 radical SAM protein [Candidatus Woesearchaeota archaeon]MBT7762606.1 radical SAM protein [Candidatus Woesearchaeota archaeon]
MFKDIQKEEVMMHDDILEHTSQDDTRTLIRDKKVQMWGKENELSVEAEYPKTIMFEVTNACNLACKMCYHKDMKRKVGFMTEELYRKVITEAKELGIENVALYTTGEAFIHPKIFEFITIAKEAGMKYVYITTNGQLLNEDKIMKLLNSGLDSIKFSIDSGAKESYEFIRVNAKWDTLVKNMQLLRKLRDERKAKLGIFASFVIMKENYDDLLNYNNVFGKLVDQTLFNIVSNQGSQVDDSSLPPEIDSKLEDIRLPKEKWKPCNLLWNRFIVNYDGTLTVCCVDFEAKLTYGDLNTSTLKECWNNDKLKSLRKIHLEKNFGMLPMCHDCDRIKMDTELRKSLLSEVLRLNNLS